MFKVPNKQALLGLKVTSSERNSLRALEVLQRRSLESADHDHQTGVSAHCRLCFHTVGNTSTTLFYFMVRGYDGDPFRGRNKLQMIWCPNNKVGYKMF